MPDSSLCRAAAPRLHPLQLLLPARLHQSVSTTAELPACIRFSCCSPLASAFSCCSRLRPFQLLPDCVSAAAPRLRPLQLCSPMASASAAAPHQLFWKIPAMSTILEHSNTLRKVRDSVNQSTKVAHHYSLVPPHEHPTSVTHRQTRTRLKS